MSLNNSARSATRDELQSNFDLSGLSLSHISTVLGLDAARVSAAFNVAGAQPEDVWLVRDYLDREIRAAGARPRSYSSLTEGKRAAAQAWFPLANVEDVINGVSRCARRS